VLGDTIRLKDFQKYRAGLDVKSDRFVWLCIIIVVVVVVDFQCAHHFQFLFFDIVLENIVFIRRFETTK
jgi:hypothetical protein